MPGSADLQKCLRNRSHFLCHLRRPREKSELARELDESRSTIDRALRELEDAGFVTRGDDGYRTTLAGRLARAEYEQYTARTEGLADLRETLSAVPADAPLDAALFEDPDVSLPARHRPHEPVDALADLLADTDHARVIETAVVPRYADLYGERVTEAGMTADLVLADEVVEWLVSDREETLRGVVSAEGVTVAETGLDHRFGLVLSECDDGTERVGVMLYDDAGIVGFVRNDTREAVAWGRTLFERVADEAVPLAGIAEG